MIVTYGWVALTAEPMGNTGCSFDPPPGDAYLYDFATVPEYRGQGFYPALLRYILGDLATARYPASLDWHRSRQSRLGPQYSAGRVQQGCRCALRPGRAGEAGLF